MPRSIAKFAHTLGDRIKIVGLDDYPGVVESMSVTQDGFQYRVGYWWNGERTVEWVRGDEITA